MVKLTQTRLSLYTSLIGYDGPTLSIPASSCRA